MDRIVKIAEIETLKKSRNPVIVYSLTEEVRSYSEFLS